jgi:hypothetical protein
VQNQADGNNGPKKPKRKPNPMITTIDVLLRQNGEWNYYDELHRPVRELLSLEEFKGCCARLLQRGFVEIGEGDMVKAKPSLQQVKDSVQD